MSKMVERVARALCVLSGGSPDVIYKEKEIDGSGVMRPCYQWMAWEDQARAAILAMRKPTEGMLLEATSAYQSPAEIWEAMIDEALK